MITRIIIISTNIQLKPFFVSSFVFCATTSKVILFSTEFLYSIPEITESLLSIVIVTSFLPKETVIHRVGAYAPHEYLVAPSFVSQVLKFNNLLNEKLASLNLFQGKDYNGL